MTVYSSVKKKMSLAFMNYLNINSSIWHTATVSGIFKTRLRKVCCPLNVTRMQCRRVDSFSSPSACSKVLLAAVSTRCMRWVMRCVFMVLAPPWFSLHPLSFCNWRASLHPRKANCNALQSFSRLTATLYWASSPVRLFSFNQMLWKIAVLPRLWGTSGTRLWGATAVWSCSRHSLINQMLARTLSFFKQTFANNMRFWLIS